MSIEAYPLYWPPGWPRTPAHERQRHRQFSVTFGRAVDDIRGEIQRLAGDPEPIISTNVVLRLDGYPSASASKAAAAREDPGAAVYWVQDGARLSMACDKWDLVEHNLRAITLSIQALRGLERWGSSQIVERAFQGFRALPAAGGADWRLVLKLDGGAPVSEDVIRARFRQLAAAAHPDNGGSHHDFERLTQARDAALREIGA